MGFDVLLAVLFAALLHAGWNALVKSQNDKLLAMTGVVIGAGLIGTALLLFVELPLAESHPYLVAAICLHMGYQITLARAYEIGDLTLVYPISRGVAPLIVMVFSTVMLGLQVDFTSALGILFIVGAVFIMIFELKKTGATSLKPIMLALLIACLIAAYSLVDGLGARAGKTSIGFYSLLSLLNAVFFSLYIGFKRPEIFMKLALDQKAVSIMGGGASFMGFAIIIWAFTKAPIAIVTGLRETSIIFAMLIGVFVFRENMTKIKLFATLICILGVGFMRL